MQIAADAPCPRGHAAHANAQPRAVLRGTDVKAHPVVFHAEAERAAAVLAAAHADDGRAAVFDGVGQRLFQNARKAQALQRAGALRRAVPGGIAMPFPRDVHLVEDAGKAIAQRSHPLLWRVGHGGTHAGAMVDHLAQVIAQQFQQRQHALVGQRLAVALGALHHGDAAHQAAAQAVMQIVCKLHALL
ncbi:hypothetical protein SDC9_179696 [bioreactor metagenome]|uniref:Uncharacterized protein n=1 Tax=bioreactor metagenome TaxID=1076179 RepID=A0A645H0K8_9ZZZZ